MPVRHLLVWLAAGAACWSLIATAAFLAPQALLALGAVVVLPLLRHPRTIAQTGVGQTDVGQTGVAQPTLLRPSAAELAVTGRDRELVAQSA